MSHHSVITFNKTVIKQDRKRFKGPLIGQHRFQIMQATLESSHSYRVNKVSANSHIFYSIITLYFTLLF